MPVSVSGCSGTDAILSPLPVLDRVLFVCLLGFSFTLRQRTDMLVMAPNE